MKKRKHIIISAIVGIIVGLTYYFCVTTTQNETAQTQTPTSATEVSDEVELDIESGYYVAPDISELVDEIEQNAETESGLPSVTVQNPEIWKLIINGKSIDVGMSVTEDALDKRPGWMDTSALPGEGTTVILGHRNNSHLRVLENADIGDVISLNVGDVNHSYTISEINIHEDSNYTIPATEGNALVLVTCYPFRYSGNAPGKAVFFCRLC